MLHAATLSALSDLINVGLQYQETSIQSQREVIVGSLTLVTAVCSQSAASIYLISSQSVGEVGEHLAMRNDVVVVGRALTALL